ncbi:alpha-N-acetylgalactosamine-specific lectin-like [Branchiostoma floridae x Branchiostoma belcheri]
MPRDAETNNFLKSLYGSVSTNFWFGLHDQREEGRFEWIDGTPLGPYNSWGPGEPNDWNNIQDCVYCYWTYPYYSHTLQWNDAMCEHAKGFICQVKPGASRKRE